MTYPVGPDVATRDDTLLNLLSRNGPAVEEYIQRRQAGPPIQLRQAFMTAAKAFRAIDAPTRGVIVPYGEEGKELIASLCSAVNPEIEFKLLRRAQQFSVNVFPHMFDSLSRDGALNEIGEGIGVYHLNPVYYSDEFGVTDQPVTPLETYYVGPT